jgi:hypothetical protein
MVFASAGAITTAKSTGVSSGAMSDRGVRTVKARRRMASVGMALTRWAEVDLVGTGKEMAAGVVVVVIERSFQ